MIPQPFLLLIYDLEAPLAPLLTSARPGLLIGLNFEYICIYSNICSFLYLIQSFMSLSRSDTQSVRGMSGE